MESEHKRPRIQIQIQSHAIRCKCCVYFACIYTYIILYIRYSTKSSFYRNKQYGSSTHIIIQWPMFVFFFSLFGSLWHFNARRFEFLWLCRPCLPCLPDKNVFWSSIRLFVRSFVQCSVDCVNAVFACMHAIFMKSPTGKLYFHFELELLQYSCSYSPTLQHIHTHTHALCLFCERSPIWDTFCVFVCVSVRFTDKVLKLFGFA